MMIGVITGAGAFVIVNAEARFVGCARLHTFLQVRSSVLHNRRGSVSLAAIDSECFTETGGIAVAVTYVKLASSLSAVARRACTCWTRS